MSNTENAIVWMVIALLMVVGWLSTLTAEPFASPQRRCVAKSEPATYFLQVALSQEGLCER